MTSWFTTVANTPFPASVYSLSYGISESQVYRSTAHSFNVEAMKLSVLGVTIVVASGDDGAPGDSVTSSSQCKYDASFPATSPYVTAVGATMGIETNSAEIVCSSSTGSVITSGGGFSNLFGKPSYQKQAVTNYFSTVSPAPVSGYNRTGRGIPDVSLAGSCYYVVVGGALQLESGTSASTPAFAGMVSLLNAERRRQGRPNVGLLNPVLYGSSGIFANDITSGDNKCATSGQPLSAAVKGSLRRWGGILPQDLDPWII